MVHVHPDFSGVRNRYVHPGFIVLEVTPGDQEIQTPGSVVVSQLAVSAANVAPDAFVSDPYGDASPALPLHLPVAPSTQAMPAQQLGPAGEALWVVGILQRLPPRHHLSQSLSQAEEGVGGVQVQSYLTAVCGEKLLDSSRMSFT